MCVWSELIITFCKHISYGRCVNCSLFNERYRVCMYYGVHNFVCRMQSVRSSGLGEKISPWINPDRSKEIIQLHHFTSRIPTNSSVTYYENRLIWLLSRSVASCCVPKKFVGKITEIFFLSALIYLARTFCLPSIHHSSLMT